tara:strand:- start:10095 stop:10796 length:702 start_codon:yes stop_codon:yes gene_type:complete
VLKSLKNKIKNLLFYYGWIIKKIYKNKSYTNLPPNEDILTQLYKSNGVIHMGAHRGTEAAVYDWLNKKTIWIEADPDIFIDLKINVSQFINQIAFNNVLYNEDNILVDFFVSNNDGASSSIFQFKKKFEKIKMIGKKKLRTISLDTLLKKNSINVKEYNFWVIDLQGAEYLVLKGAKNALKLCDSILIEISKEEYYLNGAKWEEIKKFLNENMFFHKIEPNETHQDVLFIRKQ